MPGRRWEIPGGELLSGSEIPFGSAAIIDPITHMSVDEVMAALTPLSHVFENSARERVLDIARDIEGLGPIAEYDYDDCCHVVEAALRERRLVARRKHRTKVPVPRIVILLGWEGTKFLKPDGSPLWHPFATSPRWRRLVHKGVVEYLRNHAQPDWAWDASSAKVLPFKSLENIRRALGKGRYDRVVFYTHGNERGLVPISDGKTLEITPKELAEVLTAAGVPEAVILGCQSVYVADAANNAGEGAVRVGGLTDERPDVIEGGKLNVQRAIIYEHVPPP